MPRWRRASLAGAVRRPRPPRLAALARAVAHRRRPGLSPSPARQSGWAGPGWIRTCGRLPGPSIDHFRVIDPFGDVSRRVPDIAGEPLEKLKFLVGDGRLVVVVDADQFVQKRS